jgi:hypothetical protein
MASEVQSLWSSRPMRPNENPSKKGNPMKSKKSGLVVKSNVKAGGIALNHNRKALKSGLMVKSNVKAGGIVLNHNRALLG